MELGTGRPIMLVHPTVMSRYICVCKFHLFVEISLGTGRAIVLVDQTVIVIHMYRYIYIYIFRWHLAPGARSRLPDGNFHIYIGVCVHSFIQVEPGTGGGIVFTVLTLIPGLTRRLTPIRCYVTGVGPLRRQDGALVVEVVAVVVAVAAV